MAKKMRITVEIESPFVLGKMVDKAELRWVDVMKLVNMDTTDVFITAVDEIETPMKSFLGRSHSVYVDESRGQLCDEWINSRGAPMRTYYMRDQAKALYKALARWVGDL